MSEQYVVEHSEHRTLVGPFPTREDAWAWLNAQGPYRHDTSGGVQPLSPPEMQPAAHAETPQETEA